MLSIELLFFNYVGIEKGHAQKCSAKTKKASDKI